MILLDGVDGEDVYLGIKEQDKDISIRVHQKDKSFEDFKIDLFELLEIKPGSYKITVSLVYMALSQNYDGSRIEMT